MTEYWTRGESIGAWLSSPFRFAEIENHCIINTISPFILHLFKLAGQVTNSGEYGPLQSFCSSIWNRFCEVFSTYFQNGSYHLILHNLTPMYMSVIAKNYRRKVSCQNQHPVQMGEKVVYIIIKVYMESRVNQFSSTVLARFPKLKFPNVVETLE